jgi:prolyl oligopeptidase
MALATFASCSRQEPKEMKGLSYPTTAKDSIVDQYFGTSIADPYRWLENDTAKNVSQWVKAQNEVTNNFLASIPFREEVRKRYEQLFNYEKVSSPSKIGEYYFLYKNSGLQNQSVIYRRKGIEGQDEVFIDPNLISADGTVSVELLTASKDDKYVCFAQSEAGSDWQMIKVYDVASGKETGDVLKWVKFSGSSWFRDGFFYSRYPEPGVGSEYSGVNVDHKVYYHKLGTSQSDDLLVYENPAAPNMYHWTSITEDERYLILYAASGTDGFECYYKDLQKEGAPFKALFTGFEYKSSVIHHVNGRFIVLTNIDAPNYKLVSIDPAKPEKENWIEIIPERNDLLETASTGGGRLFATHLVNASHRVTAMEYDGNNFSEIQLPDNTGSVSGFYGEETDTILFYSFTSFTYPLTIYSYDVRSGLSRLYYQSKLQFNPDDFESKQVKYTSKDGTEIPMFIVHKKGIQLNGKNPTLLYGYGGFNVSLTPSFSTSNIILLENGGIYAMPNLRGGGEFGEEWHKAGMLEKKQNVFDDFIAAAEFLIKEGYTSADYLAIHGGSNGGLLVGACMTQRPELFQVAMPAVGVLDMLRYHRFTVGWGWIPEYGCADSSETQFKTLLAYSPLHNLRKGTRYPATMIFTADHDDRVVPAHSFKFAAALQEAHAGSEPVLIRIEERAGHGAGRPTSKVIEEQADKWSFMFHNMGLQPYAVTNKAAK